MTRIFIDADACPVKDETLKVSYRHGLKVFLVSNQWMRLEVGKMVEKIVVSDGADAADDWIAEHIEHGDICITNDIPLAKRCLDQKSLVLGASGNEFDDQNIGSALAGRELNQFLRETSQSNGHNASFTKQDRSNFLNKLEQLVRRAQS